LSPCAVANWSLAFLVCLFKSGFGAVQA
jgi:hypothetical protein